MSKKVYDHAYTAAFSIKSTNDEESVTAEELLAGLEQKVAYFRKHPDELLDHCGYPFDTYVDSEDEEVE